MKTFKKTQKKQSGAALLVALVMLLISTIVGLAAIRSATQQTKLSTNMYDRSLAYQAAEAALQAAERAIQSKSLQSQKTLGTNCLSAEDHKTLNPNEVYESITCAAMPASTFTETVDGWEKITLSIDDDKKFLTLGLTPQYYIERIGLMIPEGTSANGSYGIANSANEDNYVYGGDSEFTQVLMYRVTARSGTQTDSSSRSVVALQTIVEQRL